MIFPNAPRHARGNGAIRRRRPSLLNSFTRSESGAVAILFAVVGGLLLLTIAGAVDFGIAHKTKDEVQTAADQAALIAAQQASALLAAGDRDWEKKARLASAKHFEAAYSSRARVSVTTSEMDFKRSGPDVTATLNYKATVKTTLLTAFNLAEIDVGGKAQATIAGDSYIDIHFLIDGSASMGIGATLADQTLMNKVIGCTFGCHIPEVVNGITKQPTYEVAKAAGAKMRIDVVRDAIVAFVKELQKLPNQQRSKVRISIDYFGNKLLTHLATTDNLGQAHVAAQAIELPNAPTLINGTNITHAIKLAAAKYAPGDGASQSTAKSYIVVLSDGIEDWVNTDAVTPQGSVSVIGIDGNWNRNPDPAERSPTGSYQAIDWRVCGSITSSGHQIIMGRIQYLVPTVGWQYPEFPELDRLGDYARANFAKCASSTDLAFDAISNEDIDRMLKNIKTAIFTRKTLRVTQ